MPHTTHRTVSTTLLAVGAFVLLLCLAFTVVQIACSDYGFSKRSSSSSSSAIPWV